MVANSADGRFAAVHFWAVSGSGVGPLDETAQEAWIGVGDAKAAATPGMSEAPR